MNIGGGWFLFVRVGNEPPEFIMSASGRISGDMVRRFEDVDRAVGELLPGNDFNRTGKRSTQNGFNKYPGNPGHRELLGDFLTGGHGKVKPWQNRDESQIENTSPIQVERCFAQQDKSSH